MNNLFFQIIDWIIINVLRYNFKSAIVNKVPTLKTTSERFFPPPSFFFPVLILMHNVWDGLRCCTSCP